jgi:hypothetical protein
MITKESWYSSAEYRKELHKQKYPQQPAKHHRDILNNMNMLFVYHFIGKYGIC